MLLSFPHTPPPNGVVGEQRLSTQADSHTDAPTYEQYRSQARQMGFNGTDGPTADEHRTAVNTKTVELLWRPLASCALLTVRDAHFSNRIHAEQPYLSSIPLRFDTEREEYREEDQDRVLDARMASETNRESNDPSSCDFDPILGIELDTNTSFLNVALRHEVNPCHPRPAES